MNARHCRVAQTGTHYQPLHSIIGDTVNFGMNTREVRGEYSVVVGTNPQWKQEHIRTG